MNPLLEQYLTDVRFPELSGAEHVQLLHTRDRIAESDTPLTTEERIALYDADQYLVAHAAMFYTEIARFLDVAIYRREHSVSASRWWWYLDVIQELPLEGVYL